MTLSSGEGTHEQIFERSLRYREVELQLESKSFRWLELSS